MLYTESTAQLLELGYDSYYTVCPTPKFNQRSSSLSKSTLNIQLARRIVMPFYLGTFEHLQQSSCHNTHKHKGEKLESEIFPFPCFPARFSHTRNTAMAIPPCNIRWGVDAVIVFSFCFFRLRFSLIICMLRFRAKAH